MTRAAVTDLHVFTEDRRAEPSRPVDLDGLGELLASVLSAEGCEDGAESSALLVSLEEIAALNEEYLGRSGPTDVLSFPVDGAGGGDGWLVGDVVICVDVAVEQAAGHAGSVEDELALLVVHGGLHLCGWDHASPADETAMWARERELMTLFEVTPSGNPWSDR